MHTLTRQLTAATQTNNNAFEVPESVRVLGGAVAVLREVEVPVPGREVYLEWYQRAPSTDGGSAQVNAAVAETIASIATALFPGSRDLNQSLKVKVRSRSWSERAAAVQALAAGWPDEHTRTLLTDRATTDPDEDVRRAAVQALAAGWPDEHTRTLLTDRATTDPDEDVRQAAWLATGWPEKRP